MTLVLTELSRFGIAMAADSAISAILPDGVVEIESDEAQKLQFIPYLNAGVSCWGVGTLGGLRTDHWLRDFINSRPADSLRGFADTLAGKLNVLRTASPDGSLGFHLAGFEMSGGKGRPSFYHIHDGVSTTSQDRGEDPNPDRFNANHDWRPEDMDALGGNAYITRNGDYYFYAGVFEILSRFFRDWSGTGMTIPVTRSLRDRSRYLVFQIEVIAKLYAFSNHPRSIGGRIQFLSINENGLEDDGEVEVSIVP